MIEYRADVDLKDESTLDVPSCERYAIYPGQIKFVFSQQQLIWLVSKQSYYSISFLVLFL